VLPIDASSHPRTGRNFGPVNRQPEIVAFVVSSRLNLSLNATCQVVNSSVQAACRSPVGVGVNFTLQLHVGGQVSPVAATLASYSRK
jgi:hypothetical protein